MRSAKEVIHFCICITTRNEAKHWIITTTIYEINDTIWNIGSFNVVFWEVVFFGLWDMSVSLSTSPSVCVCVFVCVSVCGSHIPAVSVWLGRQKPISAGSLNRYWPEKGQKNKQSQTITLIFWVGGMDQLSPHLLFHQDPRSDLEDRWDPEREQTEHRVRVSKQGSIH